MKTVDIDEQALCSHTAISVCDSGTQQESDPRIKYFLIVYTTLNMMARPHCRVRDRLGQSAIRALEAVIGEGEAWLDLSAVIIQMMGAPLKERQELFGLAIDKLHLILCAQYPAYADTGA